MLPRSTQNISTFSCDSTASHHLHQGPSKLAIPHTIPQLSKMALAQLQHLVPVSHQPMWLEHLAFLHLPIIYHPFHKKILQCIAKCEHIDFGHWLSDNLHPHPSLATKNQYNSWLGTWNVYLETVLPHFPLAPDLLVSAAGCLEHVHGSSMTLPSTTWLLPTHHYTGAK